MRWSCWVRFFDCIRTRGLSGAGLSLVAVAVRAAYRARCGGEVDACGLGLVLRGCATMEGCGVLRGGVPRHGRGLGLVRRRPTPLLLPRTARRRPPGGPDRNVVQPVMARRNLEDSRARCGLRTARAGRHRGHRGAGRAGLARPRRRIRPTRCDRRRAVVRAAALADLVDASLGVADPADDLAPARAFTRADGRAGARLGLAGSDRGRGAVAAELRAANHLADRPAVVSGLGGTDLHRRVAGDAGVDRVYGFPTISFISRAIPRSFSVIPRSEWVTNTKVTVRQRISISGW